MINKNDCGSNEMNLLTLPSGVESRSNCKCHSLRAADLEKKSVRNKVFSGVVETPYTPKQRASRDFNPNSLCWKLEILRLAK